LHILIFTFRHRGSGIAQWYSTGLHAGFESRHKVWIFLFTTVSRPALGSTQPLYNWY